MTFSEYLASCPARYDAEGDFVRLARGDSAMPDTDSWDVVKAHLEAKGIWPAQIDTGRQIWTAYQKALAKALKARAAA